MRDFKRTTSAEEVRTGVLQEIPFGAGAGEVLARASAAGWEHSDLVEGTIHCSVLAKGRWPFISAKWLIRLRFDEAGRLEEVMVEKGLIGP